MTTTKSKGATKRRQPLEIKKWLKRLGFSLTVALALLGLFAGLQLVSQVTWQPLAVTNWQMEQTLVYQEQAEVEQALEQFYGKSLLFLDLQQVKTDLEALPWIKQASVLKRWPGELVVNVQEHDPVAYWNRQQVLNTEGMPLTQPMAQMNLAQLAGPEGQAEQVMKQYLQFAQIFSEWSMTVAQVKKEARGSWALQLTNGIVVRLGEEQVLERSRRVVKALLAEQLNPMSIEYIDARYPNGVAIKYVEQNKLEAKDDVAA